VQFVPPAGDAARLVILDNVLAEGPGAVVPKLLDLHMLVMLGGRERTAAEWGSLLTQGGFSLERIYSDVSAVRDRGATGVGRGWYHRPVEIENNLRS